ncbi:phosphoribosylaminoimidazolesuccinocarboxamide synthase [Candidatus Hakubella thermalkaliphila]|uniref:Phosphoribosylaminoimidazole-succinocarboxamide synthase n=2 Tax=Candidatus Hakubella thermalkaliphila TaxID=2754717 RepID=A0A6V8P982_9ACTN|nr:phosphoribosylaminoimidazolesuccinocarboxamide synthase [Candidatus Hakubella thermalkaliphila]GFP27376.1 phosphoribosylaminoimidazole-succinocarboxamide synthase [Candidatus Hakubella thermalkaliphila]
MGSVKDLVVLKKPEGGRTGIGRFIFSDRYSVFDWGEMPDHIKNKGTALCIIGACLFEKLEEMGIKTHYLGVVEDAKSKRLSELKEPGNGMEIKLLRVIKPEIKENVYDYSVYQNERSNFLVPLEVIYRNSLPEGSSVFKRLKEASLKLEDIGLDEMPWPGQKLENPILDVSTKLEATDRYVTWEEAKNIAGLADDEVKEIKRITLLVNELITREARRVGLVNEDGKIELGFDEDRNLMLVDVLGTPDECRFTFEDMPVSKEVARIFYRNTDWCKEVEEAKKKDRVGWKKLVRATPPSLPNRLEELISLLYQACCNEITRKRWFATPPLKEILLEIKEVL